ncbi:Tn3 family transposase [Nonomuraea sp. NPDC001831]|uniref:Tn3 family transposase n=1 Tax=Nonomuraea sp. NPDC001831 TaxID=3364340 RepID=UPI00369EBBA4
MVTIPHRDGPCNTAQVPDSGAQLRHVVETFSMDRAFDQLEAEGHPLAEEDVARPSPFIRRHINVLGRYALHPR